MTHTHHICEGFPAIGYDFIYYFNCKCSVSREHLKSRRDSKSNSSVGSDGAAKSPLVAKQAPLPITKAPPLDVEYVRQKPRHPARSNTDNVDDVEQPITNAEAMRIPRRSKAGTLPFIFRPDRNLSPPDESTMSVIRRLIYRTSHCYCCPPRWLRIQSRLQIHNYTVSNLTLKKGSAGGAREFITNRNQSKF